MTNINMSIDLDVDAEQLWQLIGGFDTVPNWHPAIEKSELQEEGRVRILSLVGGGEIVEILRGHDDNEKAYSYEITDSPLPVSGYIAEIKVINRGQGKSTFNWTSKFSPKGVAESEAIDVISGIFQAGFDNLEKIYHK